MDSTTPTLSGLEPLMSIEELSEYLHVPGRTLYDWRLAGKGPCAVHIGRQIRYFVADVHELLALGRFATRHALTPPRSGTAPTTGPCSLGPRHGRSRTGRS